MWPWLEWRPVHPFMEDASRVRATSYVTFRSESVPTCQETSPIRSEMSDRRTMSMNRHGVRRRRWDDSHVSSRSYDPRTGARGDLPRRRPRGRSTSARLERWNGPCVTPGRWDARQGGTNAHDAKSFGKTTVAGRRGGRRESGLWRVVSVRRHAQRAEPAATQRFGSDVVSACALRFLC